MKNYRILFLGMLAMSLTFTSCKKKKDPEPAAEAPPLTPAQSESFFQSTTTSLNADIREARNSEVIKKLEGIAYVSDFTKGAPQVKRVGAEDYQGAFISLNTLSPAILLKKILITGPVSSVNGRVSDHNEAFDFRKNTGIYTWNNIDKTWDSTGSSNKIVINFPSDTNKLDVNDGKLTIMNYEQVQVVVDSSTQFLPTSMIAELMIGTTKYASLNYSGAYSKDGIPTLVNLAGYLKPYNMVTKGEDKGSSATSSYRLFKDGEESSPITMTSLNVTFDGGDKMKPVLGTGYVAYRNMKIEGAVKAKEMMNASENNVEPTEAQMNDWINFDVKRTDNNAKVADIVLKSDNEENPIMIQLNDGTLKTPETYFQSVIDEVNALDK